jgi:hypothetical protein
MNMYTEKVMQTPIKEEIIKLRPYFRALQDEALNSCCFMATKPMFQSKTWLNFSYHVIVPPADKMYRAGISSDRAEKIVSDSKTEAPAEYRKYGTADSLEKLQDRKMLDKMMTDFNLFHIRNEKSIAEKRATLFSSLD